MIVTSEELIDYMSDINLTAAQRDAAEDVIAGVQAEVETWLNRPIELTTRTETVTSDYDGTIWLSYSPIVSVTSMTLNGVAVAPGAYSLSRGILTYVPDREVVVTYVGGLDGPNIADLRLAVLRIASREMQNRHDDTLSVKNLTTTDVAPLPEGLQDEDRRRLDRYRRRTIASGGGPLGGSLGLVL